MIESSRMLPTDYKTFQEQRDIPREPVVPELSEAEIIEIANLVFFESSPKKSDILFVFGSTQFDYVGIARLLKEGYAPLAIATGLLGKAYYETGIPLATLIKNGLVQEGVSPDRILLQDQSANTLEDAMMARDILSEKGISFKSILFASLSHHSGRCWRTLRKVFGIENVTAFTYDAVRDDIIINKNTWWQNPHAKARVYGEYLRIKKYSEKGDIAV